MIISARGIRIWIGGACVALGLWFTGLVALTVLAEPTRVVVVWAPDRDKMIVAVASADVALLDGSERLLRVTGSAPGFVARLYASGAWLVLPSRASGCITPPPVAAARNRARG
jgi:hypothetical protein